MRRAVSGLRAWLLQRLSALVLLAYLVVALGVFAFDPPQGHAAWRALMQSPAAALVTLVAFAALALHAWVGARDVLLDYVHPLALRLALLVALAATLLASGAWAARALLWLPGGALT